LIWLHEHGGDVGAAAASGQLPLHVAALVGDVPMLSWLVELAGGGQSLGALRSSDGANAAHFAVAGARRDPPTALRALMWIDKRDGALLTRPTAGEEGQAPLDLWPGEGFEEMAALAKLDAVFASWWSEKLGQAREEL